jgi:hypothetical protein
MRTLKIMLAWFDWSNYGKGIDYKRPASICSLFWRTLFGLIMLPLSWLGHLYNIIFLGDFKDEVCSDNKSTVYSSVMINILAPSIGLFILSTIGLELETTILSYIYCIGVGILGIAILIGILFLVILITMSIGDLFNYIKRSVTKKDIKFHVDSNGELIETQRNGFLYNVGNVIKSFKNKYCLSISWDNIKKENDGK